MSKNYDQINTYIKEFLKFNGYSSTLECMEAEERTKKVTNKSKTVVKRPEDKSFDQNVPKLYALFEGSGGIISRESRFENDLRKLQNKHVSVL